MSMLWPSIPITQCVSPLKLQFSTAWCKILRRGSEWYHSFWTESEMEMTALSSPVPSSQKNLFSALRTYSWSINVPYQNDNANMSGPVSYWCAVIPACQSGMYLWADFIIWCDNSCIIRGRKSDVDRVQYWQTELCYAHAQVRTFNI